jgi:hypothetical protein
MIRRLTVWVAAMTVAMLMMAMVLAGAAHAQEPPAGARPDQAGMTAR